MHGCGNFASQLGKSERSRPWLVPGPRFLDVSRLASLCPRHRRLDCGGRRQMVKGGEASKKRLRVPNSTELLSSAPAVFAFPDVCSTPPLRHPRIPKDSGVRRGADHRYRKHFEALDDNFVPSDCSIFRSTFSYGEAGSTFSQRDEVAAVETARGKRRHARRGLYPAKHVEARRKRMSWRGCLAR